MTKSRAGEWILSQVLPPERAASMIGDWMEDASERGKIWFWSCVVRTVASHIWKDFTERPGFMLSLLLRSYLFSLLVYVTLIPAFYEFLVLFKIVVGPLSRATLWFAVESTGWAFSMTCGLLTGRWTGRRTGKIAGCLACCTVNLLLNGALWFGSHHFLSDNLRRWMAGHAAVTPWIVSELIFEAGFIAGFLWMHRPERSVAQ